MKKLNSRENGEAVLIFLAVMFIAALVLLMNFPIDEKELTHLTHLTHKELIASCGTLDKVHARYVAAYTERDYSVLNKEIKCIKALDTADMNHL